MHEYYYVKDEKTFVYSWQKYFQAFKTSSLQNPTSISFKNFAHFKKIVTFVATLGVSVDKTG